MRKKIPIIKLDWLLIVPLLLISVGGLFVLYSASDQSKDIIVRQSIYLVVGFIAMIISAQLPLRTIERWTPFFYVIGVFLLLVVLILGIESKGAQRWIQLPGFRFQPSEIMKIAMPAMIAWYLAKRHLPPSFMNVVMSLVLIGFPVAMIAVQPDLGTSLLVSVAGLLVLFLSGFKKRFIFIALFLTIPIVFILWKYLMHDYQRQRVLTFLNPQLDPWGAGWNTIQSMIAIGSGGISGKGWLHGTQSHLNFLPESHTDFILAVLAEEFGLVGCLVLMGLYFWIIFRGFFITLKAHNIFGRLLAGSITFTFFIYIFVNIGMVSGILPIVGVPLPMVSRGGTSIVTLFLGFGLLMAVSKDYPFIGKNSPYE